MRARLLLSAAALLPGLLQAEAPVPLEFEPRVGAIGQRILLKSPLPPGAVVRFNGRTVVTLPEPGGRSSIIVPPGAHSAFLEVMKGGKVLAKSAVPFVVSGSSLVSTPRLIGLKEAIDVFGYSEMRPEGGEKPEKPSRTVLKFDEDEVLTIGEGPPARLGPAVEMGDAASAATRGMGSAGMLFTLRPPKKKPPQPAD